SIQVPDLVKRTPKDWTKANKQMPSGAKQTNEPAPEGAWGSTNVTKVSGETMAKVAPRVRVPLTGGQKAKRVALVSGVGLVVALGGLFAWGWYNGNREQRALKTALDYAVSDAAAKQVGPEGQAAL